MDNVTRNNGAKKICLVLTGATAAFNDLMEEALKPEVLQKLQDEGFDHLALQAGHGVQYCQDLIKKKPDSQNYPKIRAFDFKESLTDELKSCKYLKGQTEEGLVITHAGELFWLRKVCDD